MSGNESRMNDALELVKKLRTFLPAESVLHETEDVRPYECDGLSAYRQTPMIVALPRTEDEVAEILKACHALKIPVVARGAGTGLSGGALPHPQGVLLSLAKLKSILGIDAAARTARVQPGVRNLAISEAAAPYGLYYAPDPSSQIACSIGGNVAENSGGVHCLKYGLTVHNILKLRVLTIEGELLEIVLMSITIPPLLRAVLNPSAIPLSPNSTRSTSPVSGSMVMIMSAFCATSAGEEHACPPCVSNSPGTPLRECRSKI